MLCFNYVLCYFILLLHYISKYNMYLLCLSDSFTVVQYSFLKEMTWLTTAELTGGGEQFFHSGLTELSLFSGVTALHIAVVNQNINLVHHLIGRGGDAATPRVTGLYFRKRIGGLIYYGQSACLQEEGSWAGAPRGPERCLRQQTWTCSCFVTNTNDAVFQNVHLVNRWAHPVFCCVCREWGDYLHGNRRRGQHQGPGLPWYERPPLIRELAKSPGLL